MTTQLQLAMKASARLDAALRLSTGFIWKSKQGLTVTVDRLTDGGGQKCWHIWVDGEQADECRSTPSAAIELAARLAPPDDPELAELLTWTACGRSRV